MLSVFDCKNKRSKFIQVLFYDSAGKMIYSKVKQEAEQEWKNVVPDSNGEHIMSAVCKLY